MTNFYPRPPRGGRPSDAPGSPRTRQFLSTSSARRTTTRSGCHTTPSYISIHVLREEDDRPSYSENCSSWTFLSTSSARRTTVNTALQVVAFRHFYPRPPRGGRLQDLNKLQKAYTISIHVLREEDDFYSDQRAGRALISIHVLREEDDMFQTLTDIPPETFLSTSSARRTTYVDQGFGVYEIYFYPRPPRGGRPYLGPTGAGVGEISIHVLREEDDCRNPCSFCHHKNFYPRPPRGGRPVSQTVSHQCGYISIHVLREEDDGRSAGHGLPDLQISIHVLREEDDRRPSRASSDFLIFLSTSSARRTTLDLHRHVATHRISIHVLREEDDAYCPAEGVN